MAIRSRQIMRDGTLKRPRKNSEVTKKPMDFHLACLVGKIGMSTVVHKVGMICTPLDRHLLADASAYQQITKISPMTVLTATIGILIWTRVGRRIG